MRDAVKHENQPHFYRVAAIPGDIRAQGFEKGPKRHGGVRSRRKNDFGWVWPHWTPIAPASRMVTIMPPASTVHTPFALLALAAAGAQPTRSSAMNSAKADGPALVNAPCHCGVQDDPAAGSTVNWLDCAKCIGGPASISMHRLWPL